MNFPKLTDEQWEQFDRLHPELKAMAPELCRARLHEISVGDPDLAVVLRAKLGEPPSMRSLGAGDMLEMTETSRYRLIERLSVGGFGEIWRAKQALVGGHDREVALKFILPHLILEGPATAQRHLQKFHQEIVRLAHFQHPNIVPLFAAADVPFGAGELKAPCYVMPLVGGGRLHPSNHLKDRAAQLACFRKVCDAVAYSHRHNLVHLDLKPDNIRVNPEGEPTLLDFGLSEELLPDCPFMPWLLNWGSPRYMAPEQIRDDGVSPEDSYRERGRIGKATDVHALGVILFEMLTDQLPYNCINNTPQELLHLICEPHRIRLRDLRADEDEELERILAIALSRNPKDRYANAGVFCDMLKSCLTKKVSSSASSGKHVKVGEGIASEQVTIFGGVHFH